MSFLMADATCRYHAPARFDDPIVVTRSIGEVRNRSFTFKYQVIKQKMEELLATGHTIQALTDLQGEVRPAPERFKALLSDP